MQNIILDDESIIGYTKRIKEFNDYILAWSSDYATRYTAEIVNDAIEDYKSVGEINDDTLIKCVQNPMGDITIKVLKED